jgi:hypothetical protein
LKKQTHAILDKDVKPAGVAAEKAGSNHQVHSAFERLACSGEGMIAIG